jgi:hypothetical protein
MAAPNRFAVLDLDVEDTATPAAVRPSLPEGAADVIHAYVYRDPKYLLSPFYSGVQEGQEEEGWSLHQGCVNRLHAWPHLSGLTVLLFRHDTIVDILMF